MFVINDDKSIYITRGDIANIEFGAMASAEEAYTFKVNDVVRFKVFKKKDCNAVVLQKDVVATAETETIAVFLSSEDTKIGDVISKPVDYWYEVELNPDTNPQTLIGYDQDGAKIFRLYPEGGEHA